MGSEALTDRYGAGVEKAELLRNYLGMLEDAGVDTAWIEPTALRSVLDRLTEVERVLDIARVYVSEVVEGNLVNLTWTDGGAGLRRRASADLARITAALAKATLPTPGGSDE